MKKKWSREWGRLCFGVVVGWCGWTGASGSGYWFDEPSILGHEDRILSVPEGDFAVELKKVLGPGKEGEYSENNWGRTLEADVTGLKVALGDGDSSRTQEIVEEYSELRTAMGGAGYAERPWEE